MLFNHPALRSAAWAPLLLRRRGKFSFTKHYLYKVIFKTKKHKNFPAPMGRGARAA